jgi:hypothetical protein
MKTSNNIIQVVEDYYKLNGTTYVNRQKKDTPQ